MIDVAGQGSVHRSVVCCQNVAPDVEWTQGQTGTIDQSRPPDFRGFVRKIPGQADRQSSRRKLWQMRRIRHYLIVSGGLRYNGVSSNMLEPLNKIPGGGCLEIGGIGRGKDVDFTREQIG